MRPRMGQGERPGARRWGFLLAASTCALMSAPAQAAVPAALTFQNGNLIVLSGLACGGVALAIAAGLWALAEQRTTRRLRRSLQGFRWRQHSQRLLLSPSEFVRHPAYHLLWMMRVVDLLLQIHLHPVQWGLLLE